MLNYFHMVIKVLNLDLDIVTTDILNMSWIKFPEIRPLKETVLFIPLAATKAEQITKCFTTVCSFPWEIWSF